MQVTYQIVSGTSSVGANLEIANGQLTRDETIRATFGTATTDKPLIEFFSYEVSSTIDESYVVVSLH